MISGWALRMSVEAGALRDSHVGGATVAGRNRPSFLKKQKEEQRRARAAKKREERRARKRPTPAEMAEPGVSEQTGVTIDRDETDEPGG